MNGSKLALAGILLALITNSPAGAAKSFSEVGGTVFRDPGLALPGAKVELFLEGTVKTKKLQETESNYRGEFLFRVPGVGSIYKLRASLKGYGPQEKEAVIHSANEHIDVNLVLSAVKK